MTKITHPVIFIALILVAIYGVSKRVEKDYSDVRKNYIDQGYVVTCADILTKECIERD